MTQHRSRLDVQVISRRATLAGRIDDTAQLSDIASRLPLGDVVIETSGVTFVNSIGMREWVRLIRVLRDRGTVTLEAVADVLMVQMNLLAEFGGGAVRIASFHAGYVCPKCGGEAAPLVDVVAHAADIAVMRMPPMPCPECSAAMEPADFPERYLSVFAAPRA